MGLLRAAVLVTFVGAVSAAAQQLHDIPWYMANDRIRAATISLCRSDNRFAHDADCLNAESAEDRLWARRADAGALPGSSVSPTQRLRAPRPSDYLNSPAYWASNDLARTAALTTCRNHPGTMYSPAVCASAEQGARMAQATPR